MRRRPVDDDLPSFHYPADLLGHGADLVEWVDFDRDEVGVKTWGDRTETLLPSSQALTIPGLVPDFIHTTGVL